MKAAAPPRELDYGWAGVTALTGAAGILAYVGTSAASVSTSPMITIPLIFTFVLGVTVGSIGLYHILGGPAGSRMALIAAVSNVIAAAQLLAMLLVQVSVGAMVEQPGAGFKAIWWGLDVAWDLYLCTGTILFALCLFSRRGFGPWFAIPGLLIGGLLLVFNIATFPHPPAHAGLVDLGPLVGLWYLAIYIRLGVASVVHERQQRSSIGPLEGAAGPG